MYLFIFTVFIVQVKNSTPFSSRVACEFLCPERQQWLHLVDVASVGSQVAGAGERTIADVTLVRFLTCVHAHVILQAPAPRERRVAQVALERLAAGVQQKVLSERAPLEEALPADLAAERPLASVAPQVRSETSARDEAFRAVLAREPPRGVVTHEVVVQVLDRLSAQVAHLPGAPAMVVV